MSKPTMGREGMVVLPDGDSSFVWLHDFEPGSVQAFYRDFLALEASPDVQIIPVFINSYGGDVYGLSAIRDLIKTSHKPVCTIAVGMAMSAGACLLAAGTKGYRFAAPGTKIMIHQVSGIAPGKAADVIESAAHIADLNNTLLTDLAKDSGNPLKRLEKVIRQKHNADWILSAEEAKKWGFIDYIGIPRIMKGQNHTSLVKLEPFSPPKARPNRNPNNPNLRYIGR